MEVEVAAQAFTSGELKQRFELEADLTQQISFSLREKGPKTRAVDPTILVAVVGAGGTALGALITGVLRIAGELKAGKISLQDKSGRKLKFPANSDPQNIQQLIQLLHSLEQPKIRVEARK